MTPAILTGVFAASIVGSLHCIGMCGPLVGMHGGARTLRLSLVHSLGRVTTYSLLGALAGLAGSAIDIAGQLGNIQRGATIVAAIVIVWMAVWPLVTRKRAASRPSGSAFGSALVRIRPRSEVKRAWMIGTLTGLLPCGWLWAFVVMAAGSASVAGGAAIMATFWLGTVPAMVGLLRFAGPVVATLRARMPAVTAIVLMAIGLGTLAMRWDKVVAPQTADRPACHHHEGGM